MWEEPNDSNQAPQGVKICLILALGLPMRLQGAIDEVTPAFTSNLAHLRLNDQSLLKRRRQNTGPRPTGTLPPAAFRTIRLGAARREEEVKSVRPPPCATKWEHVAGATSSQPLGPLPPGARPPAEHSQPAIPRSGLQNQKQLLENNSIPKVAGCQ